MSKFSSDEKAPKQEAINSLILKVSEYFDGRFEAFFTHDDGGSVLELMVEVPEPSKSLFEQIANFPPMHEIVPKWQGWRTVVMKVPVDYVDLIHNREDDSY
jgi:hypothetical protein